MAIQGRKYTSSSSYRYGFNGKENDKETIGTGEGSQDYGMRIYNPSLGKFLSEDPISGEYPFLTPYQFASNNPIMNIDIDGLEGRPAQKKADGSYTDAQNSSYIAGKKIEDISAILNRKKQEKAQSTLNDILNSANNINGLVGTTSDAAEAGMKDIAKRYQLTRKNNFVKVSAGQTKVAKNVAISTSGPSKLGKFSDGLSLGFDAINYINAETPQAKKEAVGNGVIDGIVLGLNFAEWANPLVGVVIQTVYGSRNDPKVQQNILNQLREKSNSGDYKDYKDYVDYSNKLNTRVEPLELKFEKASPASPAPNN